MYVVALRSPRSTAEAGCRRGRRAAPQASAQSDTRPCSTPLWRRGRASIPLTRARVARCAAPPSPCACCPTHVPCGRGHSVLMSHVWAIFVRTRGAIHASRNVFTSQKHFSGGHFTPTAEGTRIHTRPSFFSGNARATRTTVGVLKIRTKTGHSCDAS
eukprot:6909590-Prymnesium_polylepis.2